VPRAGFAWVTPKLRQLRAEGIPPADHQQPHQHARGGRAASSPTARRHGVMARPLLADPDFVRRPRGPRRRDQHLHRLQPGLPGPHLPAKIASCLVNPRACHETELASPAARSARRRGRRRAGLAAATTAGRARP
jgi:2,4-dienoyl-CoA reductase (NADPH2)